MLNTATFNYNIWDEWARTRSINKNVRLFVGIPGSPTAAARGYVPYTQLVTTIKPLQSMTSFGGIMIWDASQAYGNTQDVLPHYAHGITRLVKGATMGLNDTSPIELAPVTVELSPEGTIVTPVPKNPATETTSSIATTVVTSIVTSTLPITITTTCSSWNTRATYVTSDVLVTTSVPNPALPGQYLER